MSRNITGESWPSMDVMSGPIHLVLGSSELSYSPDNSDSDSNHSDDTDDTVDDIDSYPLREFGHPLERMARLTSLDDQDDSSVYRRGSFSSCSSDSSASTSSSIVYNMDYEILIDHLLEKEPLLYRSQELMTVETLNSTSGDTLMIKCLPRTSSELLLFLELNDRELREDPWNPVPHILCAVERGNHVYLCLQQLMEFNRPPFKTIANYIDFFRQALEGLTFLHEHRISQLSYKDPSAFMVDIGAGPLAHSSVEHFDRTLYPVRYYFTNFSDASRCDCPETFAKDVIECGRMIEKLLVSVPRISPKFKTLVTAMTGGSFGADDSRKLFEALCKSIEAPVFEMPVRSDAPFFPTIARSQSYLRPRADAGETPPPARFPRQICRTRSTPGPGLERK